MRWRILKFSLTLEEAKIFLNCYINSVRSSAKDTILLDLFTLIFWWQLGCRAVIEKKATDKERRTGFPGKEEPVADKIKKRLNLNEKTIDESEIHKLQMQEFDPIWIHKQI